MKEIEREKSKEPEQSCGYCGAGFPATWQIITEKGEEFICDKHHFVLKEIQAVEKEKLLWEAEWTIVSHFEEDLQEHEFDATDQWEDGSLYGF